MLICYVSGRARDLIICKVHTGPRKQWGKRGVSRNLGKEHGWCQGEPAVRHSVMSGNDFRSGSLRHGLIRSLTPAEAAIVDERED